MVINRVFSKLRVGLFLSTSHFCEVVHKETRRHQNCDLACETSLDWLKFVVGFPLK